jgi:hypothetical protein
MRELQTSQVAELQSLEEIKLNVVNTNISLK